MATAAHAGALTVSPLRLDLGHGQRGATVTLEAGPGERKTVQVETFRWRQQDGVDVYEPTRDLIVNPPLFFVAPEGRHVVRVGLASGVSLDRTREHAYRIYFREVPAAPEAGEPRIRMALRIGIPVFIRPERAPPAALQWGARLGADRTLVLTVNNGGALSVRLANLRLLAPQGGDVFAAVEGFRHVLPGSRVEWRLPAAAGLASGPARIAALTEIGPQQFPVVVAAP